MTLQHISEIIQKNKCVFTIGILIFFMVIAILLRYIPSEFLLQGSAFKVLGFDPWYNLRQIEIMTIDYPHYNWFDPMTSFPQGKVIDWGPLFPFIATTFSLLTGAMTRNEIIYASSWVPPLMAACMVPLFFILGKILCNWKAGIIASGMIAIIGGGYFLRTSFGFVDHHAAEVLFSTIFCILYIIALKYVNSQELLLKNNRFTFLAGLLSVLVGGAYILGLLVSPTMILFALIVTLYTLAQFISNIFAESSGKSIAFINIVAFSFVSLVYLLFIMQEGRDSLFTYSVAHLYMYVLLVIGTLILYLLSVLFHKKPNYFLFSLIATIIAAFFIIYIFVAGIWKIIQDSFFFFGIAATDYPIQEMMPWDLTNAWASFNVGLILMAIGIAALCFIWVKKREPFHLFVLVWTIVILFSTIIHIRYEYYLAVNVAITSAIGAGFLLSFYSGKADIHGKQSNNRNENRIGKVIAKNAAGILLLLLVLFASFSVYGDITSSYQLDSIIVSDDWVDTLEWVSSSTPDPGVDYLGEYYQEEWKYPSNAYGIISLWDTGHWITFLGKRIPNSNPFQDNAVGKQSTTAFLMAESEDKAEKIIKSLGSRYIITDNKMVNTKFENMALWYNNSRKTGYYTWTFQLPEKDGSGYSDFTLIDQPYYFTMVSRLHNFDGSMATPSNAYYLEYKENPQNNPEIVKLAYMDLEKAKELKYIFDLQKTPGESSLVLGNSLDIPLSVIPALRHYRLVYESSSIDPATGLPQVKVFERVNGATIQGDGVIEIEILTNQNRTFMYRQESQNGTFIVPYSTTGNPYPVKAIGNYRILNTSRTIDITEEDLNQRSMII